ncbi:hypothetical protein [Geopsychrobacter electrodiphilus]|uniref:hypothetical protein n=1 Tax=Geopsychrobacter electrodiphilus TaxID=225196 RepID=UPI00036AA965|nr:hypothetical protein [Geopsychrobacter electrodiphilus]
MTVYESGHIQPSRVEKFNFALTATPDQIFQLILEEDPEVLKVLLRNPNLKEEHLLTLLKRRDLAEDLINHIYQRRKTNISHPLILALVKNPGTPGALVRSLLPNLRLFELVDLCYIPGVTPDQRFAAERTILQRLPTTPVGNKITLARRATSTIVGELLKEGDARTVEACLNSPRLKEAAVFQLLTGPQATATTISMVARHSRWQQRPNLRMAILKNRQTPTVWFTLWLPTLTTPLLNQLLSSQRLSVQQKAQLRAELNKRGGRR